MNNDNRKVSGTTVGTRRRTAMSINIFSAESIASKTRFSKIYAKSGKSKYQEASAWIEYGNPPKK